MTHGFEGSDVRAARLTPEQVADNFQDLHPPLTGHEAAVAADRCYFCFDAPCVTACPTGIDIPMFIRQIAAGNPNGAAKTISTRTFWAACAPASVRPRPCAKRPVCARWRRASRWRSAGCSASPPTI